MLIAVILMHLQCGGSCVATHFYAASDVAAPASAKPACHEGANSPVNEKPSNHDSDSCGQGPAIESKGGPAVKCASLLTALQWIIPAVQFQYVPVEAWFSADIPLQSSTPPGALKLVLRI